MQTDSHGRLSINEIKKTVIFSPTTGMMWVKKPDRKTFVNPVRPGIVEIAGKLYTKRYLAFTAHHGRKPRRGVHPLNNDQSDLRAENLGETPREGTFMKRGAWYAATTIDGEYVITKHESFTEADIAYLQRRFI